MYFYTWGHNNNNNNEVDDVDDVDDVSNVDDVDDDSDSDACTAQSYERDVIDKPLMKDAFLLHLVPCI